MKTELETLCPCKLAFDVASALQCEAGCVEKTHIRCDKLTESKFEITIGKMYESPCKVSFKNLVKLSEIFGTDKIDVDDYANSGCETCDYGSDYGHTIQVINPTKRIDELKEWSNG
mgnify:CR=1 FL=1